VNIISGKYQRDAQARN